MRGPLQLISYIAPAAPATRREAAGDEPFLRPEIGFTPAWYRQHADINFGEPFHCDPAYRRECVLMMRDSLRHHFPGMGIGGSNGPDAPLDLLTGTFGTGTVAGIYGVPLVYTADNWPNCAHEHLTDKQVARLEPPNLDTNPHFTQLMEQLDWIATCEGRIEGFINWQGVLNNAHRLRGAQLFIDLVEAPDLCRHLFACVCETMIEGLRRLHARQRASGVNHRFVTSSNCLVNLVSPATYRDLLLPYDRKLAEVYDCLGIHNCAWTVNPYLNHYASIPHIAYVDMGVKSDLPRVKQLFPDARRAVMYSPTDLANLPLSQIESDLRRIARELAPCEVVFADIEAGTPADRVRAVFHQCREISETASSSVQSHAAIPVN
jgi:hypothetical protein